MSSSAQSTTYHSYSPVKMEGSDNPGNFDQHPGFNEISPNHQFLYLQVLNDTGSPLPSALFSKNVVAGMFITKTITGTAPETPLDMLFLNDTEVVIELSETANMERMMVIMTALQWWLGQKVTLQCRVATQEEVEAARARAVEEDSHHMPNGNEGDARLFRMMEDIHRAAVSNVQRDHPLQSAHVNLRNGMRDRFYQGLKKSLKESLRYLYNTGAPYETILIAARTVEAEAENFKETDITSAKSVQGVNLDLWNELANIKAVVNKIWNSQQKNDQLAETKKKGNGGKTNKQSSDNRGACFGCGGSGHFIKDCPSAQKKSLNPTRGEKKIQAPPQTKKVKVETQTEELDLEDETTPEDGQEQD